MLVLCGGDDRSKKYCGVQSLIVEHNLTHIVSSVFNTCCTLIIIKIASNYSIVMGCLMYKWMST